MMNLTEIKNSEEGVLGKGNLDSLFRNKFVVADVDGNTRYYKYLGDFFRS